MQTLIKLIEEHARKTGNACGISAVTLSRESGYDMKKTKELLNQAYLQKKARIREGINHKLVFSI